MEARARCILAVTKHVQINASGTEFTQISCLPFPSSSLKELGDARESSGY
jgi:hypothetical protein